MRRLFVLGGGARVDIDGKLGEGDWQQILRNVRLQRGENQTWRAEKFGSGARKRRIRMAEGRSGDGSEHPPSDLTFCVPRMTWCINNSAPSRTKIPFPT